MLNLFGKPQFTYQQLPTNESLGRLHGIDAVIVTAFNVYTVVLSVAAVVLIYFKG